jgi:hypothetical protein
MVADLDKPVEVVTLTETKPWYTSKTIIASVLGFAVTALGLFGVTVDPALQGTVLELATQVGALVAFVVAAWGRWVAKTTVN